MTPVLGKMYIYFNPLNVKTAYFAQRENGIFFLTESIERIQGLSSVSYQGWYTANALGGSRGVVQLMMAYS